MSKCFVEVGGGIGNQLFQIANGYAYAREHGKELVIDTTNWSASQGRHPDQYKDNIFRNFTYGKAGETTVIVEQSLKYEKLPYHEGDVSLNGYFQSYKYFEEYADDFKELLVLVSGSLHFIKEKNVAFHIRKGDYTHYSHIYGIGPKYFLDRFEEFKDYQINVFTDSPQTVLDEYEEFDFNLIQSSSEISDLTMISQHDNVVCSNSSFSWWGSLLGKKKNQIIVPDKWMNGQDCSDFYRDDMLKRPTI
jgi:hypothetical protein